MNSKQGNKASEQRISLPKPDVENITVLTKNLPNEPVLPWHRFDSPWLEREPETAPSIAEESEGERGTDSNDSKARQLTLEIVEPEPRADQSSEAWRSAS